MKVKKTDLVIRNAVAGDLENLRTWMPNDRKCFNAFVTLWIGLRSMSGTDTFSIRIASPSGLAELIPEGGVLASRPLLVMSEYDFNDVWVWLQATVGRCDAPTWPACVEKLRYYFSWEYDNYEEA